MIKHHLPIVLPVTMIVDDGPLPPLLTAATMMLYKVSFIKLENSAPVPMLQYCSNH